VNNLGIHISLSLLRKEQQAYARKLAIICISVRPMPVSTE